MTELGVKLKETREAKGISLDQLQDMTKIQKRYLINIEEGNYSTLPGGFYVRAFIKQYAEAVGLEPEALLEEYKGEVPPSNSQDLPSRAQRSNGAMPNAASSKIMDYMPKVLATFLVLAVAVGIWFIAQAFSNQDTGQVRQESVQPDVKVEKAEDSPLNQQEQDTAKETDTEKTEEPAQQETPPAPPEPVQELKVVTTSGKNATMELSNNEGFVVEITARGRCYIDIKNGAGKMFIAKTLNEGETLTQDMSAEEVVRLNIGSTPDVDVKINGETMTFPQSPTERYHQIIVISNLGKAQPAQQ